MDGDNYRDVESPIRHHMHVLFSVMLTAIGGEQQPGLRAEKP